MRGRAVVLGSGFSGLLAAGALADRFDEVVLVERDTDPGYAARRGVAQGAQLHGLLPRGAQVLEQLLPGLRDELVRDGAVLANLGSEVRMAYQGHLVHPGKVSLPTILGSRPFLEGHTRRRVVALPSVSTMYGWTAESLVASGDGRRITGVRLSAAGQRPEVLDADLVVAATGRGRRTSAWLESTGHGRPREDRFRVDVTYATQYVEAPADTHSADCKGFIDGPHTRRPIGLFLVRQENGTWALTLCGYGAGRPPADPGEYLEMALRAAPPEAVPILRAAHAIGPVVGYQFPHATRYRFDRLRHPPEGFVVVGDALCCTTPIYAAGITVAAEQVLILASCVEDRRPGLAARYFRRAGRVAGLIWALTRSSDYAMPDVVGRPPLPMRPVTWYLSRLAAAASGDADVGRAFAHAATLSSPPTELIRPSIVARALLSR